MSPAVRNVLACNNRDGEMVAGSEVVRVAPDMDMAKVKKGTLSSIFVMSFLMSWMMRRISFSCAAREVVLLRDFSASPSLAALDNRLPRA